MLFHMILNAYWEALDFELPRVAKTSANPWSRWIDTALDSPRDIVLWETAEPVPGYSYHAEARSVVMLFAGI
jgi:isoamylase